MQEKYFWHNLEPPRIAEILNVDLKRGLTEKEIKLRQEKFGKNSLPEEKPLSAFKIFLEQFRSPLIYILIIAGTITFFLRHYPDTIIIFAAVFLNIFIGFIQENKTSKTLQALKKIIKHTAQVLREGELKVVDSTELVPGDVIVLTPGSKVPADGRLLEANDLKINEMVLTGEWISAKKKPDLLSQDVSLAERSNMVYMGTVLEGGKGMALITETGILTQIGKIAAKLREIKEEKTPYQRKISHFARIIGTIILAFSFLIFILGIIGGQEFIEMFTISVAVAVAAIPEGLPVAVTLVFTFGMREILKRNGLVRKLVAAETLGSTSIICSDKTATLTEGKMEVVEIATFQENSTLILKMAAFC